MKHTITEQLPSSGLQPHEHDWQVVETTSDGTMTLVCKRDGCNATKAVKKPIVQENKSQKKLLLG